MIFMGIFVSEVILKSNDEQCLRHATCNSKNCTNGKCMCTLGATSDQATCSASITQSACEANGCFYDVNDISCVTKQGYCGVDESCASKADCFAGGKCSFDVAENEKNVFWHVIN